MSADAFNGGETGRAPPILHPAPSSLGAGPLIAASANVHPSATLGPGAVVGEHAVIGPGCHLASYAVVGPHTTLGARCQVHAFAVVGGPAQDRRTPPDAPFRLICGADNIFREGVTVSRGTADGGGLTRVGDGNLFMTHSHVGHDAVVGDGNVLANGVSLAGHVHIGHRAVLGGHAGVHQFARVGDLALVAANAMVSRDVPPGCLAAGDRATLRGLNRVGLTRSGVSAADRRALQHAFHLLFREVGGIKRAAELRDDPVPLVRQLAAFVEESRRGLCGARRG